MNGPSFTLRTAIIAPKRPVATVAPLSRSPATTAFTKGSAASGRAVYFADDAHWNAAGHEIAARELAKFLTRQP